MVGVHAIHPGRPKPRWKALCKHRPWMWNSTSLPFMGMLDVSEPDCTSIEFQWGLHGFHRSQEPSKNKTVNTVKTRCRSNWQVRCLKVLHVYFSAFLVLGVGKHRRCMSMTQQLPKVTNVSWHKKRKHNHVSAKKENKALVSCPLWEEKMEKDYFCCLVAVIELPYDKTIVACMKWRERKKCQSTWIC